MTPLEAMNTVYELQKKLKIIKEEVIRMGKIINLDDALSNKIAAGEVVERPASVVKELVENAIDANSTVIEIELVEAGLSKIRIMIMEMGLMKRMRTAFKRHATSKIKDENDLFRIRTLGFREKHCQVLLLFQCLK